MYPQAAQFTVTGSSSGAARAYSEQPKAQAQFESFNNQILNNNENLSKCVSRLEDALHRIGHSFPSQDTKTNAPTPVPNGHAGVLIEHIQRGNYLNERFSNLLNTLETYI